MTIIKHSKKNLNLFFYICLFFFIASLSTTIAWSIEPVKISEQDTALDLSRAIKIKKSEENSIQISTAPSADGIVRRIEIQSSDTKKNHLWAVFSIANPTNEQLDRWLVAPHYRLVGSGIWRPDLGINRIKAITPSEGFALDKIQSDVSDIFSVTINPGAVITFAAELNSESLPQLYLWQPEAYKDSLNSYTLYHGIILGIAGLLTLLCSILFLIRGTWLFPATAAFSWSVFIYICVDFHFINKIFNIAASHEPFWRAISEVSLTATLGLFLITYLQINHWYKKLRYAPIFTIFALIIVIFLTLSHPIFMAGIARISLGLITLLGILLIIFFSFRAYDKAIMLIPSWLLLTFFIIVAYLCVVDRLDNDIIQPALSGILVLFVLTLTFTVIQYAFAQSSFHQGLFTKTEKKALAVLGAQDRVWDWNVIDDKLSIDPDLSYYLGSAAYHLEGKISNWIKGIHFDDRELFNTLLKNIISNKNGQLKQNLRLLADDNNYYWFRLRARPVISSDQTITHCIGTLLNITEQKISEERLLKDAIYDNLTRLPNRQLLLDRIQKLIYLANIHKNIQPVIFVIDFDNFQKINQTHGTITGDNFLRIMAKRLGRVVKSEETLSRLNGDRFAMTIIRNLNAREITEFTNHIQDILSANVKIGDLILKSSVSIGLSIWSFQKQDAEEFLNEANLAMLIAKRNNGNQAIAYRPDFKSFGLDRDHLKRDLEKAIKEGELKVEYQSIISFESAKIVGFEALAKWEHPRYGTLSALDFVSTTENQNLALPFSIFLLEQIAKDLSKLQDLFLKNDYFVSFNLPTSDSLTNEFILKVKAILLRHSFKPGCIKIEVSEDVLMNNPEQADLLLNQLKDLGFHIILDHFGRGHSSLSYLLRYNFDFIKLSSILIQTEVEQKNKLLKAIIHLAHDLNIKIIAEGIDTKEKAQLLQELNCDYVQKISKNRPLPINEIIALLKNDA